VSICAVVYVIVQFRAYLLVFSVCSDCSLPEANKTYVERIIRTVTPSPRVKV